ncbi:class I SAM-dependent methyltransferase [Dactylosporangium salmoneum]|uniref:Methyltransferase type 11 domain-containing protein n=1 Tax=Dactylosporangium salmoneum TaxID=53361 RepID=A0ABP5UD77_9ACTN
MSHARYDGHADWYDATFHRYGAPTGSAGLLAELLGPPAPDDPACLDVGCGTGLHFAAVRARGHRVVGVDLSADQLRLAAARTDLVIRADARRLPFPAGHFPSVCMTFVHTDVDDFPAAVSEVVRVLRPGGRLVYLGLHPAFVGAFLPRQTEPEDQELRLSPGYGDEGLRHDPTGRFPVHSRVGSRNLTLATFLNAFLSQPALRLESLQELDTTMRPWQPAPADGRIVPWNLALTARALP